MAIEQARNISGAWGLVTRLFTADGSATHPMAARLIGDRASLRDLADTVQLFCMLHGSYPGVIDITASRSSIREHISGLDAVAQAFAGERAALVRLASAAGPPPPTPGQRETEATVAAQRHALAMLANSERIGCAIGASVGLALDWLQVRSVLDAAAERQGIALQRSSLPDIDALAGLAKSLDPSPAFERAFAFGAQQILAQHRGMWDLLEARSGARNPD